MLGMGIEDRAFEAVALAVGDEDAVTLLHAEHPAAMARLSLRQNACRLYLRGIKLNHGQIWSLSSIIPPAARPFLSAASLLEMLSLRFSWNMSANRTPTTKA